MTEQNWDDGWWDQFQDWDDNDTIYDTLCLSGGGVKGITMLGALHYFDDIEKLNHIKTYIGTSIGSVICYLLAIGYNPIELFTWVRSEEGLTNDFKMMDVLSLLSTYSICKWYHIGNFLYDLSIEKYGKIPSLKELYDETGNHLICTVCNYNQRMPEYFDYKSEPDLSCIEAIKMSCSIPTIFPICIYKNNRYVDGGLVDNYPITYVDDGIRKILGFRINHTEPRSDTFLNYLYEIGTIAFEQIERIRRDNVSDNCTTIELNANGVSHIVLDLPSSTKMDLFINGFRQAKEWMIKNKVD